MRTKTFMPCPHAEAIQFCPLYVAAHAPGLLTCCDGDMESDYGTHCAVERGKLDFRHAVDTLRAANPMLVAQCEFSKMKHDALAQVNRNLRANGVH